MRRRQAMALLIHKSASRQRFHGQVVPGCCITKSVLRAVESPAANLLLHPLSDASGRTTTGLVLVFDDVHHGGRNGFHSLTAIPFVCPSYVLFFEPAYRPGWTFRVQPVENLQSGRCAMER
jgi:hypothetical protein